MPPTRDRRNWPGRAAVGFLLAPVTPCFVIFIVATIQGGGDGGIWFATLVFPISYIASGIAGLPVYLLLKRFNYVSALSYVAAGMITAFMPFAVIIGYPMAMNYGTLSASSGSTSFAFFILAMMAFCGGLVAGTFWLLVRPDRTGGPASDRPNI
jgi:glucan phosphoethanolaminetransferase (alkaline phosphatase superfamily)